MAKITRFFLSRRRQALVSGTIFGLVFALLIIAFAHLGAMSVRSILEDAGRDELEDLVQLRTNADTALAELSAATAAEPCGDDFHARLRAVAFLPDGLNEFLYAPGGVVQCSTTVRRFVAAIVLPEPDIVVTDSITTSVWLDRTLDFLGLPGLKGTIVQRGDYAVIVPPIKLGDRIADWLTMEVRSIAPDGRSWYRGGVTGLHAAYTSGDGQSIWSLRPLEMVCQDIECIIVKGDIPALVRYIPGPMLAGIAIALLAATLASQFSRTMQARYWAFEARFQRNVDADSVVCVYQPIVETATDRIIGCEVLARWRDLDGSIVYPDRFIPIVEASRQTLQFTRYVATRAFRELCETVPPDRRIQVNFNIFPSDLVAEELFLIFEDFIDHRDRFSLVLEIVESDGLDISRATVEIEKLQAAGIRVYLDDFGTGYFSVENLVSLQVDGVKLDRCLAMAPDKTVMARMLFIAMEMIAATGRPVVVEGVDSIERMETLRSMSYLAQFVQGYLISRPVAADAFTRLLLDRTGSRGAVPNAA